MASDNSIIDYSKIQSIIEQLGSHEDTFQAFEKDDFVIIGDGTAGNTFGYPATSTLISAQKVSVPITSGKGTLSIVFGNTYASPPVITATAFSDSGSTPPTVSITTTSDTNTTGAQINVSGATKSPCIVSVIAVGSKN